jgi:uncharacterized protein (TIGR03435 family)
MLTFKASSRPRVGLGNLAQSAVAPAQLPVTAEAVREALHQQLGLRLERTRAPVEQLIVERARRPLED